jgi:hypothetical protein
MNARVWAGICLGIAAMMSVAWTQAGSAPPNGVSGVIHFTDGRQVKFKHFGTTSRVGDVHVQGYIGTQRAEYTLDELGEIHFANPEGFYREGEARDELLIISKAGDQFTMRGTRVTSRGGGKQDFRGVIRYVYLDPVTRQLRDGQDSCLNSSHITMGKSTGPLKRNPKNGQFFPSIYNFDPFTGEKLQWTSEPCD